MMCCKHLDIPELDKPRARWCRHAVPGRGCGVFLARPAPVCGAYRCHWLDRLDLGPAWRPDVAKFILSPSPEGNLDIAVDPAVPQAWRAPAYYPTLKRMAAQLASEDRLTTVYVGARLTILLPDRDEAVGVLPPGHRILQIRRRDPGGDRFEIQIAPNAAPDARAGA